MCWHLLVWRVRLWRCETLRYSFCVCDLITQNSVWCVLQRNIPLNITRMIMRKKIEGAIKVCEADKEHLVRRGLKTQNRRFPFWYTLILFRFVLSDRYMHACIIVVPTNDLLWSGTFFHSVLPGGVVGTVVMMNIIFKFVRRATRVRKRSTVRSQRKHPRTVLFLSPFGIWKVYSIIYERWTIVSISLTVPRTIYIPSNLSAICRPSHGEKIMQPAGADLTIDSLGCEPGSGECVATSKRCTQGTTCDWDFGGNISPI